MECPPRDGRDLPSLNVVRDELHFSWVTLDVDVIVAHADATVA